MSIHDAPPARRLPRSKPRLQPAGSLLRPTLSTSFWNRFLNVCGERGHSACSGLSDSKAVSTTFKSCGWSSFATSWRAALNLVLGSWICKRQYWIVLPKSFGRTRCFLLAPRTSPIRVIPPQDKARTPATLGQFHKYAVETKHSNACHGIATWWVGGSSRSHVKARSQAPCRTRRKLGLRADTALIVSA